MCIVCDLNDKFDRNRREEITRKFDGEKSNNEILL